MRSRVSSLTRMVVLMPTVYITVYSNAYPPEMTIDEIYEVIVDSTTGQVFDRQLLS